MIENLWVITPIFNPVNYQSRNLLYHQFAKRMADENVNLFTVELAFGSKPFEVTCEENRNHLQLRTNAVMWHKEKLINLAAERLPRNWEYIAWVDADLTFLNPCWLKEAVLKLQRFPVVQLFSQAVDLTSDNMILRVHDGFAFAHQNDMINQQTSYNKTFHPGFAWAMRRDAFDRLGGLLDFAILGSADQHMAQAFVGKMKNTLNKGYSKTYIEKLMAWQHDAKLVVDGNLGYVSGAIAHYWHGSKKDRGYTNRFQLLIKHGFNPGKHLERDWQGLWRFDQSAHKLECEIYKYFLSRNEDA